MATPRLLSLAEVAKHITPKDCWVVLYGNVYNVSDIVSNHPGGSQAIFQLAGPKAFLGPVATEPIPNFTVKEPEVTAMDQNNGSVPLHTLLNMDEIEVATRKINRKAWAYYYSAANDKINAFVSGKREDDERSNNVTAIWDSGLINTAGGIGVQLFAGIDSSLTWEDTLQWLTAHTHLPIIINGLQTHDDAYIVSTYAPTIKGIILSNHGGCSLDITPPAVHTLLEIRKLCPEVFGRLDVWVDGGIRRGTDMVKALCLGAKAVGIGRPALWGLAAGGVEGVERTLQILLDETTICMRLLVQNLGDPGPQYVFPPFSFA
ncbi:hypothetical protein B7463_g4745, partial [Scytalidium lignicola]